MSTRAIADLFLEDLMSEFVSSLCEGPSSSSTLVEVSFLMFALLLALIFFFVFILR